jgi:hypothetical protein
LGGLVLAGFVLTMTHDSGAQTKKTDAGKEKDKAGKDKAGKDKAKKEKAEPPPDDLPRKRVDDVDSAQPGGSQMIHFIDDQITGEWKKNNSYPSERCTDYEFIRRASIDIVGRIPTVEEVKAFMTQPERKRRAWLINEMLDGKSYGNGAEYAQNFANKWTVNLMTRSGSQKHAQDQMNDWLYEQFKTGEPVKTSEGSGQTNAGGPDWSKTAYKLIAAQGTTNEGDGRALNYILHNLGDEFKQSREKNGQWDMVPATSRTTRLFLGIRTQCVQCHDHPFNGEWKQKDFWGINAFFRQVDSKGSMGNSRPGMMMAKKAKKGEKGNEEFTVNDNKAYNPDGLVVFEHRNALIEVAKPTFLDGKKIPKDWKGTRRERLAEQITTSPYLAKAFVNRTWGHFFGTSFTRGPVDDFHEQNPISHPELLEKMAEDWAKNYHYNPKILIRWICNSQAYGLSSRANRWNDKQEDESLFARMLLKPMSPEVMYASVTVATHPRWQKYSSEEKSKKLEGGEAWYKKLVTNFGNDEGEEGSYSGTVIQALLLMNGQETNAALVAKEGTVRVVEQNRGASYKSLPMVIQDLYMHALSRPATKDEVIYMMSMNSFNFRPGSKTQPTTPQFWSNYYEDIMWALLNSNEFILNH